MDGEERLRELASPQQQRVATTLLILTTLLWGTTFITTKYLIQTIPPFFYMAVRHGLSVLPFLWFFRHFRGSIKRHVKLGFLGGFFYFLGVGLQTVGMQYSSASKASIITSLNTLFVPFIAAVFLKQQVARKNWLAVVLGFFGVTVLSFAGLEPLSLGDVLIFLCAIMFAIHILFIDRFTNEVDVYVFTASQLISITLYSFIASFFFENWYLNPNISLDLLISPLILWPMLYIALIATTLPFLFQNYGQRFATSTKAALIFLLEPVFAVFFAIWLGSEPYNLQFLIGGGIVILSLLISEGSLQSKWKMGIQKVFNRGAPQ